MGGQVREGVRADRAYNDLARRYNDLLDAWLCLQVSIDPANKVTFDQCIGNLDAWRDKQKLSTEAAVKP